MIQEKELQNIVKKLNFILKTPTFPIFPGLHLKRPPGSAHEFYQYRQYTQGDEIKNVDWKLWAKTDKYFIKEFRALSTEYFYIVLDISKSMDFPADNSKLLYAKNYLSILSFLLLNQKDFVGITSSDNTKKHLILPSNTKTQFSKIQIRVQAN